MTTSGEVPARLPRATIARFIRTTWPRRLVPGLPDTGALTHWIWQGLLEGMARNVERYGAPRYAVPLTELVDTYHILERRRSESKYTWAVKSPRTPWKTEAVAKSQFYKWRAAVSAAPEFESILVTDTDGVSYRLSLRMYCKAKNAVVEAIVETEDDGVQVGALPAHVRRSFDELRLATLIEELPEFVAPIAPEGDTLAARYAVEAVLFQPSFGSGWAMNTCSTRQRRSTGWKTGADGSSGATVSQMTSPLASTSPTRTTTYTNAPPLRSPSSSRVRTQRPS